MDHRRAPRVGLLARAPASGSAAVVCAAGLAAGYLGSGAGFAALAAGIAVLGAALRGATSGAAPALRVWIVLTALVGLRVLVATGAAREDARAWARMAAGGETVPVRAAVRIDAARPLERGGWSVRGTLSDCARPCDGAAVRWIWREAEVPREGSRVTLVARLRADPLRAPPGSRFPPAGLAPGARRGAIEDVSVRGASGPAVPVLAAAETHLEERIAARFEPELAPLVVALLLGDRGGLDGELNDAFARTGTVHILSVSGLHVVFLAELLAFALGLARIGPVGRAGAASVLLAAYAALVGALPSAVRAAAMASLGLWARAGERRVDPWQPWGAAAVAILAWRPDQLFDLGFALSFGSVAGLIAFAGPLERRLAPRDPGGEKPARWVAFLAAGVAATTAATAATLPLQAAAFGWLAPAGFLLNPVAVPLSGIGLPLAWLALAADAIGLGFVAAPLARAAGLSLGIMTAVTAAVGAGAKPWVPGPVGWGIGVALGVATALALARRHPGAAIAAAVLALSLALAAAPPAPRALEIVWLDVGQGDAIVLHFPDGSTWLVDAGPADPFGDAGRRAVLPYLRRRGVRRVERFVTTHPDLDHVGGAATIVRGIPVRSWVGGGPVDDGPAWLALLAAGGPQAEPLGAGARLHQTGVAVDVLHPTPRWISADPYSARFSQNEGSVVLLVGVGRCRALLTGDIGAPAEAALVARLGDSLRAGLLHAGHHGSRHSSSALFLARVQPRDVVVSAGSGNRYGHPHPDALARFDAAGARVWRTDRLGTVTARCGPRGWHLSSTEFYLR